MTEETRSAVWGIAVVVTAILLCTSAAGAALSTPKGLPVHADVPEDEKVEATDSVDVWERAVFPLRTNVTQSGTSVENREILLRSEERGETNGLNKETLSVFASDEQIELEFDDTAGADTGKFANEELDLIVAKLEPDEEAADSINESMGNVSKLLDELTAANANGNATFVKETDLSTDGDGSVTTTYDPSESGHYVFLLENSSGEGLAVSSGEISVSSQTTIVGMEAAMVQAASADVDAPGRSVHGENIDFDVSANLGASQTNHSIIVYDESVFTDEGQTKLILEGELNRNQSTENLTVEHDIVSVNGVADADGSVTVAGTTVGDDRVSGNISAANIVEFAFDRANQSEPDTDSQDSIVLDASAVAVEGGGDDTTLTVETFENWSTGEYRYIYTSQGDGIDDFSTATGTINIADEARSGGGGGGGGGGGDDDDDPAPAPQPEVEGDAVASSTFDPDTQTLSTQVESAAAGSSVSSSFDAETTERNLQETGASLNRITTSFSQDTQNVQVDASYSQTNPSEETPDLSEQTGADTVAYANVDTTASDESIDRVEFEFSVSRDRLARNDLSPDEVALYRFNNGEYEEYDAQVDSEGDDRVTYTAEVPGLSVFAIGEETEQVTTATPEPDTDTPEPDTDTPEPDTDTPEPDTETQTTTDTGTPGFGPVAAILGLLAAALIALGRRRTNE